MDKKIVIYHRVLTDDGKEIKAIAYTTRGRYNLFAWGVQAIAGNRNLSIPWTSIDYVEEII